MFRFWTTKEPDGAELHRYEGTLSKQYDEAIGALLAKTVKDNLAVAWIEKYGDKLLESIAPEEMEIAIKQAVASKLLGIPPPCDGRKDRDW